MEQLDFFDVPSPCIGVCQMNERGYCKGCMRNREERFEWMQFSNTRKKNVIRLCQQRYYREKLAQRKAAESSAQEPPENPQFNLFDED